MALSGSFPVQLLPYARQTKEDATRPTGIAVVILIFEIYHFSNAGLNNEFRTLVAGEESHIERTASYIGKDAIHNSIYFGVTNKRVLGVEMRLALPCPWEVIVRTTQWKSIVS